MGDSLLYSTLYFIFNYSNIFSLINPYFCVRERGKNEIEVWNSRVFHRFPCRSMGLHVASDSWPSTLLPPLALSRRGGVEGQGKTGEQ